MYDSEDFTFDEYFFCVPSRNLWNDFCFGDNGLISAENELDDIILFEVTERRFSYA